MSIRSLVDEAIDNYLGDNLHEILIGYDLWPDFLVETGLTPMTEVNDDEFVEYRELRCRRSITPDNIKLVTGY